MVKRILIRSVIAVACVVVVIGGIVSLTRGWSNSRVEKLKRELRARGEKLEMSELIPGTIVSNTMIAQLTAAHNTLGRPAPTMNAMRIVRPGVAQVAWKQINSWSNLHALLDEDAAHFAAIREAVKSRPRDLGWDYTNWNTYSTGPLIEKRKAAHWLSSAVVIELNRNRRPEALTNLLSLLDLAHCHEHDLTFVNQMIRVAIAGMAFAASWEALQATGWTDQELAALQDSWRQFAVAQPIELSLQMDRARALQYFEMAGVGDTNATSLLAPSSWLENDFYTAVWTVTLSKGDELYYLQTVQHFLDALRAARTNSSGAELTRLSRSAGAGWFAQYRYPMASAVTPNISKALLRWLRIETQRQIVMAAIGLERFKLRTGRYPQDLSELVPDILPALPVDFGDGQPLRYELQGQAFRLWSTLDDALWPRAE